MADKTITIRLSGAVYKFKADDTIEDPDAIVRFITQRIEDTKKASAGMFQSRDPVILLLTTLLDLSRAHLDLLGRLHPDAQNESDPPRPENLPSWDDPSHVEGENQSLSLEDPQPHSDEQVSEASEEREPESNSSLLPRQPCPAPDSALEPETRPEKEEAPQKSRPHFQQLTLPGHETVRDENQKDAGQNALHTPVDNSGYRLPHPGLLSSYADTSNGESQAGLEEKGRLLCSKLEDFGILGEVVQISPGPVITTFSVRPAPGVKISRIVSLADDLALALSALGIRIVAPIPGKDVVGVEIPNTHRQMVGFREMISSPNFRQPPSCLSLCLGKDIKGRPYVADLAKMPHLLIAGATGAGKSVAINAMVLSMLFKADPDAVKFIMIDPKRIELSLYADLPHLITPVVCDMKEATGALFWAVEEMERRYELLAISQVRAIDRYNQKAASRGERLPYIVVIIDELADLMMVSSRDVEVALTRLAQMARAAGIHLILATQRPSVDVLTGVIKANFPTRISFKVSSKTDSRTILDANGAESLLGKGDMLFLPPNAADLRRLHGPFVDEGDIGRVTQFIKTQRSPAYIEQVTCRREEANGGNGDIEYDDLYDEAVALVVKLGQASISNIQRHMRIGYNRAARMVDVMEKEGIVGPSDGSKPREVLFRDPAPDPAG